MSFTIVNTTQGHSVSSLTIPATTAGNLLVVSLVNGSGTLFTGVTDNAAGGSSTYIQAVGAQGVNTAGSDNTDIWYSLSVKGGATSVAFTGGAGHLVVYEVSAGSTFLFATANQLSNQTATTTPLGAPVTTTDGNDIIFTNWGGPGTVTGIHAGNIFVSDSVTNHAWAHLLNTNAPGTYQAQWDSTSSTFCSSTAAFASIVPQPPGFRTQGPSYAI